MNEGNTPAARRLMVRLATAFLFAGILLLSFPGAPLDHSAVPSHHAPSEPASVAASARLSSDLVLYRGSSDDALVRIVADVAVDDGFVDQVGGGWEAEVDQMVAGANSLLEQVGVRVEIASIQRWRSDDAEVSIADLLAAAEKQVNRAPGRLFLAITFQDTVKFDGWAQTSAGRVIAHHYHEGKYRNYALIAHEVGHVLGARHHADHEECPDHGCIMDEKGYVHATTWCKYHRQVIQDNVASLMPV